MNEEDIVYARLATEEGKKPFAYNDATGKRVTCLPSGHLSIGIGINLENGLEEEEMELLARRRITKFQQALGVYKWYVALNPARRSVFLDLAFNNGMPHLLHYVGTIGATAAENWQLAHDDLLDSDAARELPHRYGPLAVILLNGVIT